jgi:ABC-2 type transport system ATP-binding protein
VAGADLLSWTADRAVFSVDSSQEKVSDVIAQLSEQLELADVAVEATPIDEIIVQLYKEHSL